MGAPTLQGLNHDPVICTFIQPTPKKAPQVAQEKSLPLKSGPDGPIISTRLD
jgi:hypothetical protein